ncbi:MAG TPA: alanine racemase [Mycobacteriales bacterium]|nr:alanine racemase [Mycobacteriales bacterium]
MRSAARIDLGALAHNVGLLAERAAGAQVMAVVKADAYGHGLVPCATTAVQAGAAWLGVAFLEEALALRSAGLEAPVLAWLFAPGEDLGAAVQADVDLGVYSAAELDRVVAAAGRAGRPARVHLKADTGLSRGGATTADWPELCEAAAKGEADGTVVVVGVWSHLASSEQGPAHPTNAEQRRVFEQAVEIATGKGLSPQVRHLANSGALLTDPATHFDLVRPGAALYGLAAVAGRRPEDDGLRPVMSLVSRIALTKRVPAGAGVSYGHRYTTSRETTLALVPLGYGDGVPRAAGQGAPVQVAGRRHQVCGTVAMDQFVVDVGDDEVAAGDEVVLFGPGGPTVQEWADVLGTIDYEVVTRIGARVPREHVGGGR